MTASITDRTRAVFKQLVESEMFEKSDYKQARTSIRYALKKAGVARVGFHAYLGGAAACLRSPEYIKVTGMLCHIPKVTAQTPIGRRSQRLYVFWRGESWDTVKETIALIQLADWDKECKFVLVPQRYCGDPATALASLTRDKSAVKRLLKEQDDAP